MTTHEYPAGTLYFQVIVLAVVSSVTADKAVPSHVLRLVFPVVYAANADPFFYSLMLIRPTEFKKAC